MCGWVGVAASTHMLYVKVGKAVVRVSNFVARHSSAAGAFLDLDSGVRLGARPKGRLRDSSLGSQQVRIKRRGLEQCEESESQVRGKVYG